MAASEVIVNTVHALQTRAAESELTLHEFQLGMKVLLDAADQVRALEAHVVPPPARLTPDQLADGQVVLFPKRPPAPGSAA